MSMQEKVESIVSQFSKLDSWEDRYRELIKLGKNLTLLSEEELEDKLKIDGCQSELWLKATFEEGKIYYQAYTEALLVKGIVGLLLEVYSGESPDDILTLETDFLSEIGIQEHLSMNRSSGLASMLKQIKLYAFAFKSLQA